MRKKITKAARIEIYNKTSGKCAYCGIPIKIEKMQIDHVTALSRGGKDDVDNMLPACRSCNHRKGSLTLEDFRAVIEAAPNVLMRNNVTYKNAVRYHLVIHNPHAVKFYFERMDISCE